MDFPGVTSTQIENKLITESYKKFYVLIIADFFATIFFAFLIWDQVNKQFLLLTWVLVMFVFNHILRGLFLAHYHRQKKQGSLVRLAFWKKYFILNNLQSGILWSLGGLLFLYIDDPLHRMAIFVYLIGLFERLRLSY